MRRSKIISALSFAKEITKLFPYLEEYSNKVDRWLEMNKPNEDFIRRFILISFWPDYQISV